MGFWSGLAKLGGYIAAPFTGGASIPIGESVSEMLSNVGSVAGSAAGSLADQKNREAQQQAMLAQAELAQKKYQLDRPSTLARQAMIGNLMGGATDASVSAPSTIPVTHFSGGLRPSLLGAESRGLGTDMARKALLSQLQGESFQTPIEMPKTGFWGNALGAGGTIASLLGALGKKKAGTTTVPTPDVYTYE